MIRHKEKTRINKAEIEVNWTAYHLISKRCPIPDKKGLQRDVVIFGSFNNFLPNPHMPLFPSIIIVRQQIDC